jgi:hypothetical protein
VDALPPAAREARLLTLRAGDLVALERPSAVTVPWLATALGVGATIADKLVQRLLRAGVVEERVAIGSDRRRVRVAASGDAAAALVANWRRLLRAEGHALAEDARRMSAPLEAPPELLVSVPEVEAVRKATAARNFDGETPTSIPAPASTPHATAQAAYPPSRASQRRRVYGAAATTTTPGRDRGDAGATGPAAKVARSGDGAPAATRGGDDVELRRKGALALRTAPADGARLGGRGGASTPECPA